MWFLILKWSQYFSKYFRTSVWWTNDGRCFSKGKSGNAIASLGILVLYMKINKCDILFLVKPEGSTWLEQTMTVFVVGQEPWLSFECRHIPWTTSNKAKTFCKRKFPQHNPHKPLLIKKKKCRPTPWRDSKGLIFILWLLMIKAFATCANEPLL